MQSIVSRCRALLSLQPIKQVNAEQLDRVITNKIHELLRFPYTPNMSILTLPLNQQGLDFPSIARINARIAVDGLMQDLNHHIKAYRDVARISYADWTCRFNNCENPIDGQGLEQRYWVIMMMLMDWHNVGVRLVSRIFSELQRNVTRQWEERKGKERC